MTAGPDGSPRDLLHEFELLLARVQVGSPWTGEVERVCTDLLAASHDGPFLRLLAMPMGESDEEIRSLLLEAASEVGVVVPDREYAIELLVVETARSIIAGGIGAYQGARQIDDLGSMLPHGRPTSLDPFVYCWSEWLEWPEDRTQSEGEIWGLAAEILGASARGERFLEEPGESERALAGAETRGSSARGLRFPLRVEQLEDGSSPRPWSRSAIERSNAAGCHVGCPTFAVVILLMLALGWAGFQMWG